MAEKQTLSQDNDCMTLGQRIKGMLDEKGEEKRTPDIN